MVHVEPGDSEPAAAYSYNQSNNCNQFIPGTGDHDEKQSLSSKPSAVEELPHVGGAQDLTSPQVVRQLTPQRNYNRHDQMG